MSWHHEDYLGLASAIGGVIAACAAAFAAIQSRISSKASLEQMQSNAAFERSRYLQDLLRSDANKVNGSINSDDSNDWTFNQIANITKAISSAKQRIIEISTLIDAAEVERFKEFFKNQISQEIMKELSEEEPPSCIYKVKGDSSQGIQIYEIWSGNKEFFGFVMLRYEHLKN